MNRIKIIGMVFLFFISINIFSQTEHVILWDVTYSMKGFNGNKIIPSDDVWEQTKEKIIQQIDNIKADGKSSIYILPFQNPADNPTGLDWKIVSDFNLIEKERLKEWVKDFVFDFSKIHKSTNVCKALDLAYEKISSFSTAEQIILALYSDGAQSDSSKLSGSEFDHVTCLNEQVNRFCDLCDKLERNRLYLLKLKNYTSNVDVNCKCIIKVSQLRSEYRAKPNKNDHLFLEKEMIGEHLFVFNDVFGERPDDLIVSAISNNPKINVRSKVVVKEDGSLVITFTSVTVDDNQKENATISFSGTSGKHVDITIESLSIEVENVKKSKIIIKEIKIK